MHSLLRGVLQFRLLVLVVAAGVLAVGVVQTRSASVDVLPEFTPPYAQVQTEALGLSAEEVEQLITVPLEADLLNGVEGIDVLRSDSVPGLSSIVMVFEPGTDVYRARQLVEERLTQAHALPNVSSPPELLQPLSSSNRLLMIGLSSEEVSGIDQSVIARWTVRPRLMGVPGVANVSVWGMRDQQLQVQVDPERLRNEGVTLSQVIRSAGNAQVVSPLSFLEASTPGTGGFIETPQQRLQVRHLLEQIADPDELGKVPVVGTNGDLRLSDVATIVVDHQPLIGDAVVAGGEGLVLVVEKFPGADTLAVTEGVEDALEQLKPGLSGISTDTSLFRPASYIGSAVDNLGTAFAVGAGLVLLVLLALRFHWRSLVITLITVPLSIAAALLLLSLLGQGLNVMVLAGLAAALAVVVDEAIASSDRVVRHLRARDGRSGDATLGEVIREGTVELRRPLVYATLIVLAAIVPLAIMGGRPGAFFAPLVLGYVLAVLASAVVAMVVTPALSTFVFARWEPAKEPPALHTRVRTTYTSLLRRFAGRLRTAVVVAAVLAVVAVSAAAALSAALVPTFKDLDVLVRLESEPGTSNDRMTQITTGVVDQIREIDGVENVGAHVGRAVSGDRVTNVNSGDVWVAIRSDADYDATMSEIEATVQGVPGVRRDVLTYSSQKLRDVGAITTGENVVEGNGLDVLTGFDDRLVVRMFGQDTAVLAEQAARVRDAIAGVEGVVDPRVDLPPTQPTVEIEVDLDRAQALGVTPGDVRRAEATLVQGIQVGSVFEEQKVFDVIVQGVENSRSGVDEVRNLLMDRPDGGYVRLGDVADVRVVDTPSVIRRDAVSRRMDVVAEVSGRGTDAVVGDVEARLAGLEFPMEYHAEVLDEGTSDEIGTGRVVGFGVGAALAALLLLQAAFRSWRLAALVAAVVPLSLTGGLVVALAAGGELTLGALLGLLAVLGLSVRTSTVLADGLRTADRSELNGNHSDGAARAAEYAVPVLMTYAAVAALLAPLAVLGSRPGLEILHPMALTVLGGLVTSALTTLFVLPALTQHLMPPETMDVASAKDDEHRTIDLIGPRSQASSSRYRRPERSGSTVLRDGEATT
jgi:Cu/Ag efflux pump CusA